MNKKPVRIPLALAGLCGCALLGMVPAALAQAQPQETPEQAAARTEALRQQIAEQTTRLEALKREMAAQEASLNEVRRALGLEALGAQRGRGGPETVAQASPPVPATPPAGQAPAPVGQAPEGRQPVVAPIFEQPGVLTPKGKFVIEPALQYSYSSSNRVALVGYTIIPALHIGVIDVREVKRNTTIGMLTTRFGVSNRMELEARLPYVYRSDTSIGREFLAGTAEDTGFQASGRGIGDVELSARYQFNDGGLDRPYFIGGLRLKTRTGKDPFEVPTVPGTGGLLGAGLQAELPTGSGFVGLQPSVTALFPSDPAVFFGTVSYLHSFGRKNVEGFGDIRPGGVIGFNFGMGLSLNERSSFSIGYDHASVGRTKQNGVVPSDSVRVQLGTLLLGYSYRLNPQRTLNLSLGAGLTRDTPDVTLTVRVPTSL
jgi:hypothetical protein